MTLHSIILLLTLLHFTKAQNYLFDRNPGQNITWCTTSSEEQLKCYALGNQTERDMGLFGSDYHRLNCIEAANKDECMGLIDLEKADITELDAGETFIGGRYHSLVPIMQEVNDGNERHFYSVAVIKKGDLKDVHSLRDLRGKKACFPGVGTLAGWIVPIYRLMKYGDMQIIDCNNHVKSTINFFGPSCAVNSLIDKYNPIGDNSDKLCELCIGTVGQKCTTSDPYYGFEGAFRCLVESGDIAFLKHGTVFEMTKNRNDGIVANKFELLCRDGSRRDINDFANCNWGTVPSHTIVTSSAKNGDQRRQIQRFLKALVQLYGKNNVGNRVKRQQYDFDPYGQRNPNPYNTNDITHFKNTPIEQFKLFDSSFYGRRFNVLVQDSCMAFDSLEESKQTYSGYLGDSMDMILGVRDCPVNKMTLCVTSEPELEKCIKMKSALKAQLLKPEMQCYKAHSHVHCMQAIKARDADVVVLDAGDIYTAGVNYGLIPFVSEVYNLGKPEYYVVAVAKEQDDSTELTYLKGKFTCHPGIHTAAGWVIPLALMISNGWIRSYGCNSIRAAAEYFTKSCVPGAQSAEYNFDLPYDNMCDLCHGPSYRYCRRDAGEDYYGDTGALKCLVEGGGEVAFVKHTTVSENTNGKKAAWWARNQLLGDFELLCPDGKRGQIYEYERCALGKAKANAIVTRGGDSYNETQLNAYINLFLYAQQFYGRKDEDYFSFSMFYTKEPYSDLIFQDATQQLQVIPEHQRRYDYYLGPNFLRAKRIVDCHASSDISQISVLVLIFSLIMPLAFIL